MDTKAATRAKDTKKKSDAARLFFVSLLTLVSCVPCACRGGADAAPVARPGAAAQVAASSALPHGDHNPHHGGTVLMNGDLHFEVVLHRDGRYQIFFSDAARTDLPASYASAVRITVTEPSKPAETIALQIDDAGESWIGRGRPVESARASARVEYTAQSKPYWIDIPFS